MIGNIIILIVFLFSLVFRLFFVSHFNFAFTIDQARDMLELRKIAVGHDLVFIGPVTSLNGVFLGPFWFYFNLLPFLIGKGDPNYLAFWQVIFFHMVIFVFWRYFRKKNYSLAFWGSLFLLVSPRLLEATSYPFNANTTPSFVLLSLVLIHKTLESKKRFHLFLLGILIGLTIQIEAAFGVILLPLVLSWIFIVKIKSKKIFFLGFLLTLIPQIMFEIKHGFMMTKVFVVEFSGKSDILGQHLGLIDRIIDRYQHYTSLLFSSLPLGNFTTYIILFGMIFLSYLFLNRKQRKLDYRFFLINLSLIVFSLFFFFLYPGRLKDWWTINLSIPYLMIFASFMGMIPRSSRSMRLAGFLLFVILIVNGFGQFRQRFFERVNIRSNDRALLLNQIEAVDTTYKMAGGEGFKVYDFTPAVYDNNYQYLFWWYGNKKYGYLPEKVTYQDNVPNYIEKNDLYWTNSKSNIQNQTFLIIESDPNFKNEEAVWRSTFDSKCETGKKNLIGNITVERLSECPKNK